MTQIIPLTALTSVFEQTVVLDGTEYGLRFRWNTRSGYWYLTVTDAEGTVLASGRKITADRPLLQRDTDAGLPPGDLWCITTTGADPGLRDLGGDAALLYVEASDL